MGDGRKRLQPALSTARTFQGIARLLVFDCKGEGCSVLQSFVVLCAGVVAESVQFDAFSASGPVEGCTVLHHAAPRRAVASLWRHYGGDDR